MQRKPSPDCFLGRGEILGMSHEGCSSGGVLDPLNVSLHLKATFCLFAHMISQERYNSTPDKKSSKVVRNSKKGVRLVAFWIL